MLLKKLVPWGIGFAVFFAACFVSKEYGYLQGVSETRELQQASDIARLNLVLNDFNEANKKAAELNLQLSQTISARKKADAESTKVFANALTATAHLRFNCVFNDNIMQHLFQAADRADKDASSGVTGALRAGTSPDG